MLQNISAQHSFIQQIYTGKRFLFSSGIHFRNKKTPFCSLEPCGSEEGFLERGVPYPGCCRRTWSCGWEAGRGTRREPEGTRAPENGLPGTVGPTGRAASRRQGVVTSASPACPTLDIICRTQGKMKSQKVINHCRTEAAEQWPERGAILSTELGDCHSGLSFLT